MLGIFPVKINSERITQKDKELVNDLNYTEIEFSVSKMTSVKLKQKTKFVTMFFVVKIN